MFRVDFNNEIIKENSSRLMKQFILPNITSTTFLKVSHQCITFLCLSDYFFFFFQVFPFCVAIDPEMRISQLGPRLKSLFNPDSCVIGKHISDVFTLLRPDILHIEWEKVYALIFIFSSYLLFNTFFCIFQFVNYGKSVVFVMESCIPLKTELSKTVMNRAAKEQNINGEKLPSVSAGAIRLKGQMKYIPSWHKLAFLCHPM